MENVFYYTSMSPNDIYSKADRYLNERSVIVDGGDVLQPKGDFSNQQQQEYQRQEQQESSPPQEHYYQQPQVAAFSSPVCSPPHICSKVNSLEHDFSSMVLQDVPVKIGEVINPANFYLVFLSRKDEYDAMKLEMKSFYETNGFPLPIIVHQLYAAKLEGTHEWGRVKVLNLTGKYSCCYFIDEGITVYISESKLFLLDDKFKKLPPRSIKAALLGLSSSIWSFTITNQFKSLVIGKELMAFIQSVEDKVCKCILANGVNVNEEISKMLTGDNTVAYN